MPKNSHALRLDSCKVHFIYSFLVNLQSRYPFEGENPSEEERKKAPIERLFAVLEKNAKEGEAGVNACGSENWTRLKPDCRIGVTTNLSTSGIEGGIYCESSSEDFFLMPNTNPDNERVVPVKLSKLIRINDSGSSTVTLEIALGKDNFEGELTAIDVHNIYNLVGINAQVDPLFYLSKRSDEKGSDWRLFDIFWGLVKKIEDEFISSGNDNDKCPLILDRNVRPDKETAKKRGRKFFEWQNPFVLTEMTLAVDFDQVKLPPWVGGQIRVMEKVNTDVVKEIEYQELITLWARFLKGKQLLKKDECRYVQTRPATESSDFPINYSWHKDVFIGFHGRGGTVISYKKPRESAIVQDLTESYLDLLETLRARWHLCVLFGELISLDLDTLIKMSGEKDLFSFTLVMIQRRELFIRFLTDRTMYAFEGGIVSEICHIARNDLYVDALTNAVIEKFTALEKYYRERIDLLLSKQED